MCIWYYIYLGVPFRNNIYYQYNTIILYVFNIFIIIIMIIICLRLWYHTYLFFTHQKCIWRQYWKYHGLWPDSSDARAPPPPWQSFCTICIHDFFLFNFFPAYIPIQTQVSSLPAVMTYDVEIPRYCDVPNLVTLLQVHPNASQK